MEKTNQDANQKNNKNEKKSTLKACIITIIAILAIAGVITGVLWGIQEYNKAVEEANKRTVPNLVGKTLKEAEEELANLDLNIEAKYPALYSDSPDAVITEQQTDEGEQIKKGDTVGVIALTQEQMEKKQQEEEENKRKQQEAKEKGYRQSPATNDTIIGCAKTLINNTLKSSATAIWGKCEVIDEDNYGRCLVYVSLEAQNGFGAYTKLDYFVVLQYVEYNGEFTYKPYSYSYKLSTLSGASVYDYYVSTYKSGEIYPVIQKFLDNNDWNTRPTEE